MASIKDDRGYNQGFVPSKSTTVRMRRRTDLLLSEMHITRDTRILEIGCGTGEVSYWMAERTSAQVLGTDLCAPFILEAKRKYRRSNLRYDIVDFNAPEAFGTQRFDYIVGNGILHHLYYHLDEAFERMQSLLKDGGQLIFLEPNIYNPYIYSIFSFPWLRAWAHLEPDEMAFPKRHILDIAKRTGFNEVRVDYKDFLLPGIPSGFIVPSIVVGAVFEQVPLLNMLAQSIFIRARKGTRVISEDAQECLAKPDARFGLLIRYGLSGLIGAAIPIIFLYGWVTVLGFKSTYLFGLGLGFIVALIVTFALQKYWAFRDRVADRTLHQLLSYSAVAFAGLTINTLLLALTKASFEHFGIDFFNRWYLIAQIVIIAVVSMFNFAMNYLFTFQRSRKERLWEK